MRDACAEEPRQLEVASGRSREVCGYVGGFGSVGRWECWALGASGALGVAVEGVLGILRKMGLAYGGGYKAPAGADVAPRTAREPHAGEPAPAGPPAQRLGLLHQALVRRVLRARHPRPPDRSVKARVTRQAQHLSRSRSGGGWGWGSGTGAGGRGSADADPVVKYLHTAGRHPTLPHSTSAEARKPAPVPRRDYPDVHPPAPPLGKFLAGPVSWLENCEDVGTLTMY